jgi:triacylglycerol lipase
MCCSTSDEAFKKVGMMNLATDKGIWQVRPVQYDWDHLDLVGLDTTDYKRTGEESFNLYLRVVPSNSSTFNILFIILI